MGFVMSVVWPQLEEQQQLAKEREAAMLDDRRVLQVSAGMDGVIQTRLQR